MAINCSLSESALKKLRQKVYKNLSDQIANGDKIDIKKYMKSVYDLVYNKNQSTVQALDAAKVIPMFINQLQGVDNTFRKGLGRENLMQTLDLIDQFTDEANGLKNAQNYLGISKKKNSTTLKKGSQIKLQFPEEEEKKEKKKKKKEVKPKNTVNSTNALGKLAQKIQDKIVSLFTSSVPTFLATARREFLPGKGRTLDPNAVFKNGVQRELIKLQNSDPNALTSADVEIPGIGRGYYLKAIKMEDAAALAADPQGVQLQIVDRFGDPIKFTEDFKPSLRQGEIPVFYLNAPQQIKDGHVYALNNFKYPGRTIKKGSPEFNALKQEIQNEIDLVNEIRKYVAKGEGAPLMLEVTSGSLGQVEITYKEERFTKLNKTTESLEFSVAETTNEEVGTKAGFTYATATGLHGKQIRVEQPGLVTSPSLQLVKDLLFEEVINLDAGGNLSVQERINILDNYLDIENEAKTSSPIIMVEDPSNPYGFVLQVATAYNAEGNTNLVTYDLSNPQEKAKAQQEFERALNEVRLDRAGEPTKFLKLKTHINKGAVKTNQVQTATISRNAQGQPVLTKTTVPLQEFLSQEGFSLATPDISPDGKFRLGNPYFVFKLTDMAADNLNPKTEAEKNVEEAEAEERNDNVDEDAKENGHDDGVNPFDTDDLDDTDLMRSLDQAKLTPKQVQQKIDEAREWYEKSLLNDIFPFDPMFDKVNKEGVAQWTMAGVTLYKGSDFTDLYHEAWHGFTQGLLSKAQKRELYDEVKRKRGTFTDYKGKQVSFKEASDRQIEEYLAEEFRSYMLKGGKEGKQKLSNKTKSFFQKILDLLEYLFTDSSYNDVYADAESNNKVNELFEKLRLGNLSEYSFSAENVMFGKLNTGITSLEDTKGVNMLTYQESTDINDMLDFYVADFATLFGNTQQERDELAEIESKLKGQIRQQERIDLEARRDALRSKDQYMGAVTQSSKLMAKAYKYAEDRLTRLRDDINKQYLESTNETEKAKLYKQKQTLDFVLENFGDTTNLKNNLSKESDLVRGVIGYHMSKTAMFQSDNIFEEKVTYDKSGNELSLSELARPEIIFMLKSLPSDEVNKYGVTKLAAFNATWNRLARTLQNTHSLTEMYDKLEDLAVDYPPIKILIERLGDPMNTKLTSQTNLQSAFFQTFAKSHVPLIQLTLTNTNKGYKATVGEAFNSDYAIGRRWQNDMTTTLPGTNEYVSTDKQGRNYVNVAKLLQDFTQTQAQQNPMAFYNALGFKLTDVKEIREQIKEKQYDPTWFHKALTKMQSKNERLYDYRSLTEDESVKYKALMNLEAKYSDVFSNFAVTNAEGNTQFEHTLNNSMTIMVNSINNAVNYKQLISQPHMQHLDVEKNPFAEASVWMRSLFNLDVDKNDPTYGDPIMYEGSRVKLKLMNLSGALVREGEDATGDGISSASADKFTKLLMDLHLSKAGGFELMRHADKGTSYAIKIDGPIKGNVSGKDSYIPVAAFMESGAYENLTYERLLPHVIAEVKRIRIMKGLAADESLTNFDFNYLKEGQEFHAFNNVFSNESGVKDKLMEIAEGTEDIAEAIKNDPTLNARIKTGINQYFNEQYEQLKKDVKEAGFVADNVLEGITKENPALQGEDAKAALMKAYIHNAWIHNIESISVLYGDLAQYNHEKEEFHKRNAGIGSTGTIYRTDEAIKNHINENLWGKSYANQRGLKQRMFNGQFNTAVIEDMSVPSAYIDEYKKQLGEGAAAYGRGQNEADAQGLISFDSYRQLKVAEGTWSNVQEKLFQDIAAGKEVTEKDVLKFFPVIKAQYWGPLANQTTVPITAFHKYSLFPLIPSVIKGTNAEDLHHRMMQDGIDYLTFESGSKVGNITKTGDAKSGKRNFDSVYEPGTHRLRSELNTQTEPYFTKNTIHLEYLKNQLNIHDEPKGKVVFSTQLRKLVEDGLMTEGVPNDLAPADKKKWKSLKSEKEKEELSNNYRLLRNYERNLEKLTEIAKYELLQEMDWKSESVDGKEVLTGDIENLLSFIQKELSRQDLAQHEIDFLQFNEKGEIKHDLSKHTSVEKIEKMLNALMVKRLVNVKVNGEGLIQVASTFMESKESTGRDYTNPTEEDLEKYGSNDLPFYRKGKGPNGTTSAMKVKVALQGDFQKLLKLKDKEGNIVGTRENLNKLIKDEEWLNTGRNREMITMVAVRIPVQGMNSMEFMEVYEFLDPSAGSVIVPPTEIVTKSGADFDVDKMTVMMPNIRNAKYQKNEFGFAEQVAEPQMWNWTEEELTEEYNKYLEAQKEIVKGEDVSPTDVVDSFLMKIYNTLDVDQMVKEEVEELIKEGKVMSPEEFKRKRMGSKAVQNDLITNIKDIVSLSDNFESLMTPNDTNLLDPSVEKYKESAMDFNPLDNLYGDEQLKGKKKNKISSTRVLEYRYNLYKHQSNKVGKEALGLGAVDNTYNALFNRIGAYMNATTVPTAEYQKAMQILDQRDSITDFRQKAKFVATNKEKIEAAEDIQKKYKKQTILLDHNTMQVDGETAISLSAAYSKGTNVKISDLINQLINGWVDVAKDAWIFNLQGNKEVSPTLLFMLQAGVPIDQAVSLVSSPLVKEYIKQQQLAKSTFANPLGLEIVDVNQYRKIARNTILSRSDYGFNVKLNSKRNVPKGALEKLTEEELKGINKFDTDKLFENTKKHSKAKKADNVYEYDNLDRQAFLHYLELEKMGSALRDVKMRTNVDTSRDESLFAAQNRLGMIQALREDGRIPESIVDGIMNNSPISSFFIQGFQINLLGRLFPLRNHKTMNDFARNLDKNTVDSTYGDKELTVSAWKSDFLNFVFQNELKYFRLNDLTHYKGYALEQDVKLMPAKIKSGAFVQDGKMYIDKNAIIEQYNNEVYNKATYNKEFGLAGVSGVNVFNDVNEYANFVLERELMRSQVKIADAAQTSLFKYHLDAVQNQVPMTENESSKAYNKKVYGYAYELYLRDSALHKINNFNYLFKHSTSNYAARFIQIKNAYPELAESLDIMTALSTTNKIDKDDNAPAIKNIMLNDSKLTADQKNLLYENIQKLSDINEIKDILPESSLAQRQEIATFFTNLSTYAFIQAGMNVKSKYALTQIVPQDTMLNVLSAPTKQILKGFDNPTENLNKYMDIYTNMFTALNSKENRSSRMRGKDYFQNISVFDKGSINTAEEKLRPSLFEEDVDAVQTETEAATEITKTNYTRAKVKADPDTAYVFTENNYSITAFPNKQGGGSAVIRPEENAFAIVTKKKYDYNTRENVDYSDTEADFKEFTEVNTKLINDLKNSGKSKIVFPQGFAVDKAEMPTRFAEWLQKALLDNFGLVTELNANKTGLISKSVELTAQPQVDTTQGFPKTTYSGALGYSSAPQLVADNPNTTFVYESPVEDTDPPRQGTQYLHKDSQGNRLKNTVGLTSYQRYSTPAGTISADVIRDKDGDIDPNVKEAIDNDIANIKEAIEQGQTISFSDQGYGQNMLEYDKQNNQFAPETFLYLSQQLQENFGYLNPGYLTNNANKKSVEKGYETAQASQEITDVDIREAMDQEVREFIENCI